VKIKIEAHLYVPAILQWTGTINPIVVIGIFDKHFSPKDYDKMKSRRKIFCKGILLNVRKIDTKNKLTICFGNIPSVSIDFFKKLKKAGWKINKKALAQYQLPSNQIDRNFKRDVKERQQRTQKTLEQLKLSTKPR